MHKIYLVEDELDLANIIKAYLEKEEYEVTVFENGKEAIEHINDDVKLWILDIMLKDDVSGYDIIKEIRKTNTLVPIIFTSARDKDVDKILGLQLGSDDYLAKPYSPKELVLRVSNMIRRTYNNNTSEIIYQEYKINENSRTIKYHEKEIKLTTFEFELLLLLLKNKGITFSRDKILENVWSKDYYGSDRAVDDLMRRLRKKMPELSIETIYGFGYRLL